MIKKIIITIVIILALIQLAKLISHRLDQHALATCEKYNDCQEVINHINQ